MLASSPVEWLILVMAEPFRLSDPLPLPKRSFIKELPSPTAFLDFGCGMLAEVGVSTAEGLRS